MINTIKQAPFLRLLFIFICGILFQLFFKANEQPFYMIMIITFGLSFSLATLNKISYKFKYRWVFGICIHLFFFQLGVVLTAQKQHPGIIWRFTGIQETITADICDYPQAGPKTVHCPVRIIYPDKNLNQNARGELLMVSFQKDTNSLRLKKGDCILLSTVLRKPLSGANPGDFDYAAYLNTKGIHAITYVETGHWHYRGTVPRFLPMVWSDQLRSKLVMLLTQSGLSGDELAVATSLLIGDQSAVDNDIKRAYKASGTMHVLAVSGMHVALIYEVLLLMLSFLNKIKHGTLVRCIITLIVIWLYAMVTGLSPSVLRATVMFTFIVMGLASNRIISVFNSLSASAFFLLLINPLNIIDVGFQLSYFAVAGIVILYPQLNSLFEFKYRLGNQLWSLTAVTLAAQISTTPISLYYFHQFPNLFLVSNLIVVPLSTVVIYAALILTILSSFHLLILFSGKVLFCLVWLLNTIVKTIENIPFAVSDGFHPLKCDTFLIYMFIICLFFFVFKKHKQSLICGMMVALMLQISNLYSTFQNYRLKEIIVYQDKNNRVVQFRKGRQSVWIIDNYTPKIQGFVKYAHDAMHCDQNIFLKGSDLLQDSLIRPLSPWPGIMIKGSEIQFLGKHISLINRTFGDRTAKSSPDYIITEKGIYSHGELYDVPEKGAWITYL